MSEIYDKEAYAGPLHNVAWHIHLLYVLIMKDGLTVRDIKGMDPVVTRLVNHRAGEIAGEWESGIYSSGAAKRMLKLINDFIII